MYWPGAEGEGAYGAFVKGADAYCEGEGCPY